MVVTIYRKTSETKRSLISEKNQLHDFLSQVFFQKIAYKICFYYSIKLFTGPDSLLKIDFLGKLMDSLQC